MHEHVKQFMNVYYMYLISIIYIGYLPEMGQGVGEAAEKARLHKRRDESCP
jgi:hypothetical protein